jgi:hypothetical protein
VHLFNKHVMGDWTRSFDDLACWVDEFEPARKHAATALRRLDDIAILNWSCPRPARSELRREANWSRTPASRERPRRYSADRIPILHSLKYHANPFVKQRDTTARTRQMLGQE